MRSKRADDHLRSRHRVHLQRHARLDESKPHRLALHRARQTDAERHLRELQRAHARRLLNETLFFGLDYADAAIATGVADYNERRPHSALRYQTLRPSCRSGLRWMK